MRFYSGEACKKNDKEGKRGRPWGRKGRPKEAFALSGTG